MWSSSSLYCIQTTLYGSLGHPLSLNSQDSCLGLDWRWLSLSVTIPYNYNIVQYGETYGDFAAPLLLVTVVHVCIILVVVCRTHKCWPCGSIPRDWIVMIPVLIVLEMLSLTILCNYAVPSYSKPTNIYCSLIFHSTNVLFFIKNNEAKISHLICPVKPVLRDCFTDWKTPWKIVVL